MSDIVPPRLAPFLIDAYLIDGALYCYDCAEQIGMPFVQRHIRVQKKLECRSCAPNPFVDTLMKALGSKDQAYKKALEDLRQMTIARDEWRRKYNRVSGVLQLRAKSTTITCEVQKMSWVEEDINKRITMGETSARDLDPFYAVNCVRVDGKLAGAFGTEQDRQIFIEAKRKSLVDEKIHELIKEREELKTRMDKLDTAVAVARAGYK